MMAFEQQRNYPESHVQNDLPGPISSQVLTKPVIPTYSDLRSVISTSGSLTNGGSAYIYLPNSSNSFLKSGSAFLNFQVALTYGNTGANSVTFGGGPVQDASALINRMQISSNSILENIQFYAQASQMYALNKTNSNFISSDLAAMSGASYLGTYQLGTVSQPPTQTINVSVPVLLGVFNSPDSYFPLCLCSSTPTILIDFENNLNKAFSCSAGQQVTQYVVSNIQLIYESVNVDASYVRELKEALKAGATYNFSSSNIQMISIGDSTTISQEYGLSCSSLNQVSWMNYTTPLNSTGTQYFSGNSVTLANGYCDNQPLISGLQQDITTRQSFVYANNKNAWSNVWDPVISYGIQPVSSTHPVIANDVNSPYASQVFTSSFPMLSFNEAGLIFSGRPCTRFRVELVKSAGASGSNVYVLFVRDCVYQIGMDGSIVQHF